MAETDSRTLPDLPNKKNKTNWVEKAGGLPSYINRIAKHLHDEKGMDVSRAIAVAVNTVKRWCSSGTVTEGGKGNGGKGVTAKTKALACKAVAEWEAKKGASHVNASAVGVKERLVSFEGVLVTESDRDLILSIAAGVDVTEDDEFDMEAFNLALAQERTDRGLESDFESDDSLDMSAEDGDFDEGAFELALVQERRERGLDLAVNFEEKLHPRGPGGRWIAKGALGDVAHVAMESFEGDKHNLTIHHDFGSGSIALKPHERKKVASMVRSHDGKSREHVDIHDGGKVTVEPGTSGKHSNLHISHPFGAAAAEYPHKDKESLADFIEHGGSKPHKPAAKSDSGPMVGDKVRTELGFEGKVVETGTDDKGAYWDVHVPETTPPVERYHESDGLKKVGDDKGKNYQLHPETGAKRPIKTNVEHQADLQAAKDAGASQDEARTWASYGGAGGGFDKKADDIGRKYGLLSKPGAKEDAQANKDLQSEMDRQKSGGNKPDTEESLRAEFKTLGDAKSTMPEKEFERTKAQLQDRLDAVRHGKSSDSAGSAAANRAGDAMNRVADQSGNAVDDQTAFGAVTNAVSRLSESDPESFTGAADEIRDIHKAVQDPNVAIEQGLEFEVESVLDEIIQGTEHSKHPDDKPVHEWAKGQMAKLDEAINKNEAGKPYTPPPKAPTPKRLTPNANLPRTPEEVKRYKRKP